MEETEVIQRRNTLFSRAMWSIFILVLVSPFLLLKMSINKDYDMRQELINVHLDVGGGDVGNKHYSFSKSDWHYIGRTETHIRPIWADGGYMTNLYAVAVKDSLAFIAVVTLDDKANEMGTEPYEINKRKGSCTAIRWATLEHLDSLRTHGKAGRHTENILVDELCQPARNKFEDTDYSWSFGGLHITKGAERALGY